MKKLTPLQLFAMMFCARCFSIMIFFPVGNTTLYLAAVAVSTGIQAVMILPLLIFQKVFENDDPCTLALSRCKPVGVVLTFVYMLYFMAVSFFTIGNFSYFIDMYFSDYIPRLIAVICCTLGAIYLGKMNVQVIGKTATLVAVTFLVMSAFIVAGSYNDFDYANFHIAERELPEAVGSLIKSEFMRNSSLVVFAFLLPKINGSAGKTAWTYLFVKLAVLEIIVAFITIILGDFAQVTRLPFFSLAAYSHTQVIERYDAAFMAIWVLMTLVKLGTFFHCSGECVRLVVPKLHKTISAAITGIIPAVSALFFLIPHKWEKFAYYEGGAWAIVILAAVIPALLLIFARGGGFSVESENAKAAKN